MSWLLVNPFRQMRGPYHEETLPIGSCVCDPSGWNCLTFTDKPGAKFTSLAQATAIAEEANKVRNAVL